MPSTARSTTRSPPYKRVDPQAVIDAAADEFDRELPGYECDVEYDDGVLFAADNYDEVKHDFIARKLEEFGWDPDEYEEEIYGALDAEQDASHIATMVACQGGGGREECEIAASYCRGRENPPSICCTSQSFGQPCGAVAPFSALLHRHAVENGVQPATPPPVGLGGACRHGRLGWKPPATTPTQPTES